MLSLEAMFGDDAAVLRDRNFQALILVAMMIPFGTGLMSPILDSLIDPLGATATNIGWMISMFWAPSILVIPVTGILADRFGRKPVLVPSLVLFGVAGTLVTLTTDFHVALLLRLLQGIGWAGLTPVVVTSIGDFYTESREATAQGLRLAGGSLAGTVISLLAGVLVVIAWQYPFLLYLSALPVAVAVYQWFDEPASSETAGESGDGDPTSYRRSLFDLVRHQRVLAIVVARPLPMAVWIGFSTYNSVIVIRFLDGTPVQAGVLFGLFSLVTAVAASQAGRVTTLFGSQYLPLVGAYVSLLFGFGTILFAPRIEVAGIGVLILGVGHGLAFTLLRSLLTGFAPDFLRAGLVSIGATGDRLLGTLTPIAMGLVIEYLTPVFGFVPAVRFAGLGISVVGGLGGVICISLASVSSPVPAE